MKFQQPFGAVFRLQYGDIFLKEIFKLFRSEHFVNNVEYGLFIFFV